MPRSEPEPEGAEAREQQALAHCSQGNALAEAGRFAEALHCYGKALQLCPHYTAAHFQMGVASEALGHADDAASSYQRALQIEPNLAPAHLGLGNVLRQLGQLGQAVDCYRRALAIDSDLAVAWNNLGATFRDLGLPGRAVACCRQALQIDPRLDLAHYNLANAQKDLLQFGAAAQSYREALVQNPGFVDAQLNLGSALSALGQTGEALDCLSATVKGAPDDARAHARLADVLKDLGRFDEAMAAYRRALSIQPDDAEARSNMLFCLSHGAGVDAKAWLEEHRAFGARFNGLAGPAAERHANSKNASRTLKVGFVSADFRTHAVATFFEPLLQRLCQSDRLSLHAYSNHPLEDEVTLRLKLGFAQWTKVVGISDAALADQIRSDGIDILVDLSGHTGGNRLLCFARRAAPVQVSWLGYPGTTGLAALDYYLADRRLVPDASAMAQFTEQLVYLPAVAPFLPPQDAPDVTPLPALNSAALCFGSFNRMSKLSPAVVALWSMLLREVADSRMRLVGLPVAAQTQVAGWFAQEGIVRDRLEFHPRCSMAEYLALHQGVDICLDTFPYNGATTTSLALWMGVPTLTLAGTSPQGRVGAAILNLLGLEPFVASTPPDFVQRGLAVSSDRAELAALRAGLRSRLQACPDIQPALISDALERAFRLMWQRWRDGLPPTTLDVSDALPTRA